MSADLVAAQSDELISVLEQIPEGVFVLDAESKVIFANKPGLRLVKMKPKKALGEAFPFELEDGTMRDFDVEMLVKPMTWGGQEARLVHLKPLKSAGAFHLEWKLESAIEKARSAEIMLEEWKSREGIAAVGAGEVSAEVERSLEETLDQLTAARGREDELSQRLDEYEKLLEGQRREFDERMGELESLLEMAEGRADELQSELVAGDHESATELSNAITMARDAEEQIRTLEVELSEAKGRIQVSEEQAEVAEERAYSLETEIERLEGELAERSEAEAAAGWDERIALLEAELALARATGEDHASTLALLDAKEEELQALLELLGGKEEELLALAGGLGDKDEELSALTRRLAEKDQELLQQLGARGEELSALEAQQATRDRELQELTSQLALKDVELELRDQRLAVHEEESTGLVRQLEARDAALATLSAERDHLQGRIAELETQAGDSRSLSGDLETLRGDLATSRVQLAEKDEALVALGAQMSALQARLEDAEDVLRVRSEESDELAEQLRAETELSEELVEQLRGENEALHESLREHTEELESLREMVADAESLVSEFSELKDAHEEALAHLADAQAATEEADLLRGQVDDLQTAAYEAERLQNEVQKLASQLESAQVQAEKGDKADKLERKLEGALRRAEEAEERLGEERRLLAELRQTSERRIQELESRAQTASPVLGASGDNVDPETERLAFQDPLTGLPNRNILHRYLGFMLKQSARYERYTALLRIDCDKFKSISDTFGSDVGDRLIRLVGERLSAVVRGSDVLGRLGEDEFVILLSELSDQKEASVVTATVIKRIYQMLKKPFAVDDQSISVGVSIGVSLYPLDASNGEQMFQHSAVALKRAKETGRGQAQYFTPEVQSSHEARTVLDQELKLGLERNEFGLLYQPIFDLSNGQIVGVEALIRWNHPRLGSIGPDEFLKVAEESGIIVLIGNWALRSALQRSAQWQQAGLGLFVSLNLSRRQLLQADLIPTIHTALTEFRCSPDRILLEVSEELTGPELPKLRDTLANLQQLGVRLAVDNFGTSASSLQELRRGPFQVLKIDRRFVHGVPTHEENAGIVLSALTMGHHLGRITVAVGVETEAEKAWLAKTGCRFAQGNLLAHPLPAEQVGEIVLRR